MARADLGYMKGQDTHIAIHWARVHAAVHPYGRQALSLNSLLNHGKQIRDTHLEEVTNGKSCLARVWLPKNCHKGMSNLRNSTSHNPSSHYSVVCKY
jgi:hypothetical protein